MKCKYDDTEVVFRSPKKSKSGFLRLTCPKCGRNYEASNHSYAHLIERRPRKDKSLVRVHVSGRREQYWLDAVIEKHGSFQGWLDNQPLP